MTGVSLPRKGIPTERRFLEVTKMKVKTQIFSLRGPKLDKVEEAMNNFMDDDDIKVLGISVSREGEKGEFIVSILFKMKIG